MSFEKWADNVWIHALPHNFMGLHLGVRQALVKLSNGELLVYSPVELTAEARAQIDAIGPLKHIVCPNTYHHVFAKAYVEAFPGARVYAPKGLVKKRRDLRIDHVLDARLVPAFEEDFAQLFIPGSVFQETVLVHRTSKTLICADLAENFVTSEHWPTRWYLKAAGLHGKASFSRPLRLMYTNRSEARRVLATLFTLDFDRVILAHGDPIRSEGKEAMKQALAWL